MWPVDLMLVNQETFDKMSVEAREKLIDGIAIKVPSPLHLIAMKLHALRHGKPEREAKDLTDVFELIHLNDVDVKSDAFRALCEKFGTTELYERIRQAIAKQPPESTSRNASVRSGVSGAERGPEVMAGHGRSRSRARFFRDAARSILEQS